MGFSDHSENYNHWVDEDVCVEKQGPSEGICVTTRYQACYTTPMQILQGMLYPCQQRFMMESWTTADITGYSELSTIY